VKRDTWIVILFVGLFAIFRGLNLVPVTDEFWGFGGFFHLLRWVTGADDEAFSTYLTAAWSYADGNPANLYVYHWYHVRFAWGFVYPLLSTLYAACAEGLRWLLGNHTDYVEILVRAGNAALVAHWLAIVALVSWGILQFRDAAIRAKVALAATVIVLFDYLIHNNYATLFHGHPVLGYLHEGFVYAMTLWSPRSAVSVLLGLYLAARILEVPGRRQWLIPLALCFHLPSATMSCLILLGAEAVLCAVRRKATPDLVMLAVGGLGGLLATASVGFTGFPASTRGLLPAWDVFQIVIRHAMAHPAPNLLMPLVACGVFLLGGIRLARVAHRTGEAIMLLVLSAALALLWLQLATGWAIVAKLITWHDNPSVHSLLYAFSYASSTVALGVSLWLFVRGGEWLARAVAHRISPLHATAVVALAILVPVFLVGAVTSPASPKRVAVWPQGPVGEAFRQIWKPERWRQTAHAHASQEKISIPQLPFSDRRLLIGKDYVVNSLVYLRALHQWAVWGPVEGKPEIVPELFLAGAR